MSFEMRPFLSVIDRLTPEEIPKQISNVLPYINFDYQPIIKNSGLERRVSCYDMTREVSIDGEDFYKIKDRYIGVTCFFCGRYHKRAISVLNFRRRIKNMNPEAKSWTFYCKKNRKCCELAKVEYQKNKKMRRIS